MRSWSLILLAACNGNPEPADPPAETPAEVAYPPSRITFGSCSDQRLPDLTLFDVAAELSPEIHVFLGDNVYADTEDMDAMAASYTVMGEVPSFQRLDEQAELLATWDDHDYGANDAGAEYPMKAESKEVFLEFWREPPSSPRFEHEGIYTSYVYPGDAHTLQIILLDTRTFRGPLTQNDGSGKHDYLPNDDPGLTMLGAAQWTWLEEQLAVPADLRIIASSNQLGHEYNGWESWTNFPVERQRLLDLLASSSGASVALSGDVHYGEISKVSLAEGHDLYDVTSSGINRVWTFAETNNNRVGKEILAYNVGLLEIDWAAERLTMSLRDAVGAVHEQVVVAFADISP